MFLGFLSLTWANEPDGEVGCEHWEVGGQGVVLGVWTGFIDSKILGLASGADVHTAGEDFVYLGETEASIQGGAFEGRAVSGEGDAFAVVVHTVEDEVAMGIGCVVVTDYDILSVLDSHLFHILLCQNNLLQHHSPPNSATQIAKSYKKYKIWQFILHSSALNLAKEPLIEINH